MKIIKYNHSCLLVEEHGKFVLLDPDEFTYQAKVFNLDNISNLDAIGITHEHMDHMSIPFIKEIFVNFPNVKIFSNESVKNILAKENINVETTGNDFLQMIPIPHEKMWGRPKMEENVQIDIFNKFTHPGDSLSINQTKEILALPITAPWGSTTEAVEKALEVKPKYIIPIHDFMLKDESRRNMYKWLEPYFAGNNIKFFPIEAGEIIEI